MQCTIKIQGFNGQGGDGMNCIIVPLVTRTAQKATYSSMILIVGLEKCQENKTGKNKAQQYDINSIHINSSFVLYDVRRQLLDIDSVHGKSDRCSDKHGGGHYSDTRSWYCGIYSV